jgi:hypothetical protein
VTVSALSHTANSGGGTSGPEDRDNYRLIQKKKPVNVFLTEVAVRARLSTSHQTS